MSAVRRAQAAGYTDAIFVNENDHVVESGFSNLIILTENGFVTPADESGCLPGVMREILLSSFGVNQSLFTYEQLLQAQAVYTCSSIRLIQHVSKVDDTLFSESANGRKLIGDFADFLQSKITP
jgi:branched-subunit amino acid aminotransferase/4-amino-4-deoxychorismate lyase